VVVRDVSGSPIEGAHVTVSGPVGAEAETDARGTASIPLAPGSYRFRFEREGFITLERDVTIRTARPTEMAVVLNGAPAPPEPPPPADPPPAPAEPPVAAAGPPVNVSIPEFLEKSFVGREPMKESILSCMPDATARLIQLREPVTAHTHADVDEVLYVVAGDGALRIGNQVIAVTPGSMSAIPRGTRHSIERRGRNPLILLSTLAGASCPTAAADAAHGR
jgi:mannose-6-phosphate isomerase-like protein (cupin superfamily)